MKYKQLVQKKLFELSNMVNFEDSLLSQNRPINEHREVINKMRDKIKEIEDFVNREKDTF